MRWGVSQESLTIARRYLPLVAAGAVAIAAELSTSAMADVVQFRPFLGIEQIFTDNVRGGSDDRDADGITVLSARAEVLIRTSRINAAANVTVAYNEFWGTNDLDSFNGNGVAAARVEGLKNFFFIDALAERQQVYLRPQDESASGLLTGVGQIEQSHWEVSPFVQTTVFGLADLLVRGRYAQVLFDKPVVGVALVPLQDATLKQVAGRLTTGERASSYEALVSSEYIESDTGFKQSNIVGGLNLNLTQSFTAIGRMGYEHIEDPTLTTIKGPVWSVGGRYRLGKLSVVHAEYGRRFDDNSWLGDVNLVLTPRLTVTAAYEDTLTPIQFTLTRTLDDLLDTDGNFGLGSPSIPTPPNPLLLDQVVRDKDLTGSAIYVDGLQTYTLASRHTERFFPSLAASEKLFGIDFFLNERLSRSLAYTLSMQYEDNYETVTGNVKFQSYQTGIAITYNLNNEVALAGGYAYRLVSQPDDVDNYENVLRMSVTQAF